MALPATAVVEALASFFSEAQTEAIIASGEHVAERFFSHVVPGLISVRAWAQWAASHPAMSYGTRRTGRPIFENTPEGSSTIARFRRRINTGPIPMPRTRAQTNRRYVMSQRLRRTLPKLYRSYRRRRQGRVHQAHAAVSTSSSRLIGARGNAPGSGYTVVERTMNAPTPTQSEGGSTLTNILKNPGSATAPDGSFGVSYHFQLDQMHQYVDFTDAYQWYKILSVKLTFVPLQNAWPGLVVSDATNPIKHDSADGSATSASQAPVVALAPDATSDALFTSLNEAMAHSGSRLHVFNDTSEMTVYLVPKPTGLVGVAGSEIQVLTPTSKWISTDSATVPHYGLRVWCDQLYDTALIRVFMTMKVAFKGVKS